MAKYYVTVGDSMAQATTTFAAVQTQPDGGTLSTIKVPPNMNTITQLGFAVISDGAITADTGAHVVLRLSGTGIVDGSHELLLGGYMEQNTGTGVIGTLTHAPAKYRDVSVKVKPGEINVSAAYFGTDPGTPFLGITLGFDNSATPGSLYYVRHDSMAQATTSFAAVETDSEGATAGPIAVPPAAKRIKSISALFSITGAQTTNTGILGVVRLSGTGALPDGTQEFIVGGFNLTDGAGTLTYDASVIVDPVKIPTSLAVNGSADLSLSAAYFGTDAGTPQASVEIEFE